MITFIDKVGISFCSLISYLESLVSFTILLLSCSGSAPIAQLSAANTGQ